MRLFLLAIRQVVSNYFDRLLHMQKSIFDISQIPFHQAGLKIK